MGERAFSSNSSGATQPRSPSIQEKLTINQTGDAHGLEADQVANTVMRSRHRTCSSCLSYPNWKTLGGKWIKFKF